MHAAIQDPAPAVPKGIGVLGPCIGLKLGAKHRHDLDCGRLILTHLGEDMANRRGKLEIETADDGLAIKL